jgi:hypothetical protein
LIVARASLAQERIFLDEQIRFSSKTNNAVYAIPLLYRLSSTTNRVSIARLRHAFQAIIIRHNILRTALYLDKNGTIIQHCLNADVIIDDMKAYQFSVISLPNNSRHTKNIVDELLNQSDLFDLSKGRVINCHILRQNQSQNSISENYDLLDTDDLLLFSIHHAVFDGASILTFIHDLLFAYESQCSIPLNENTLKYIDYSVHERLIDMTSSQQFWHSQFQGYTWKKSLSLPVDRHHSSNHQRSGLAFTTPISLNNDISNSFINYATSHHITLFQLGLATFYLFLFKLSHAQTDLCIACLNANRNRTELQNMIGMFVSTLPFRIQFDSHWSFDQLVEHVREKCLSILEHSHYPLQHILTDFRLNSSNISFLDTLFDFITISSDVDHFSLNGACLEHVSLQQSFDVAKFDFSMIFMYNSTLNNNQLCCSVVCSRDLFDETTVTQIGRRFQYFCEQLFSTKTNAIQMNESMTSITKLSLILPEEGDEIEAVKFQRLENVVNEGM